jgi:hypothetical protein
MSDRIGLNLARHQNVSVSYAFLSSTDYSTASSKITGKAGWTIFIQRIVLSVTTDNAATQTFQDSAGTPVPGGVSKASPGLGPIVWDFGEEGFALTEAKDFQHKMSGTGMAGAVVVQAYMKPTASTGLVANVAGTRAGL